ncbi:hypothetical protein [Streptomyces sp. NBC_01276]|uniref:hypothetical protein n=1 Tax=Streptomyces sp. NBC_01276 TaxID=2903808 RepID=UPI00352FC592
MAEAVGAPPVGVGEPAVGRRHPQPYGLLGPLPAALGPLGQGRHHRVQLLEQARHGRQVGGPGLRRLRDHVLHPAPEVAELPAPERGGELDELRQRARTCAAFPELRLDSYLNPEGRALVAGMKEDCVAVDAIAGSFKRISDLTTRDPLAQPDWRARLDQSLLGGTAPAAPV